MKPIEFTNDEMEKNQIISKISVQKEFKLSLVKEEKLFLCEKYKYSTPKNKLTYFPCICRDIICETCQNLCHHECSKIITKVDNKQENYRIINENPNFMVSEYYSSCECTHLEKSDHNDEFKEKANPDISDIPCFFSYFLCNNLDITDKYYTFNETLICNYCFKYCTENKRNYKKAETDNKNKTTKFDFNTCKCAKKNCKSHKFDLVLDYTKNIFTEGNQNKILVFGDIVVDFKSQFNKFLKGDNKLVESISDKFGMIILIYKPNLKVDFMFEKNLLNLAFEYLETKNKLFFFSERKNIALTYIFYFYKKYFFSKVKMVGGKLINMLSLKQRLEISDSNKAVPLNDDIKVIIKLNFLLKIFKNINELRYYSIKISDDEPNVPFFVYFLKLFFQVFYYQYQELNGLFDLIKDVQYKFKDVYYNNQIKSNVDEIYYIFKIHETDKFLRNISLSDSASSFTLIENKNNYLNKILNFEVSQGDKLRTYLKIIFRNIQEIDYYNEIGIKELIKSVKKQDLIYLDSFHGEFFGKLYKFITEKSLIPKIDIPNFNNNAENFQEKKKALMCYEVNENDNEENRFEKQLDKILTNLDLFCLLDINEHENLLNYLFYKLKNYYFEKKILFRAIKNLTEEEKKLVEKNFNFEINLKSFWKDECKKESINLDSIKFQISDKTDIEQIFNIIFIQEFYKKNDFNRIKPKFNLLLFALLTNKENMKFLLTNLKFLDYLFLIKRTSDGKNIKKSFLIYALFNTKQTISNYDFIWKCLYILFRNVIEEDQEYNYLKSDIVKLFIDEIIEFYHMKQKKFKIEKAQFPKLIEENQNKLKESINFPLIYYFFKILKRILIKSNFKQIFPLDYNVNNYSLIENINHIIEIVFLRDLNLSEYFHSLKKIEGDYNSIYKIQDLLNSAKKKDLDKQHKEDNKNLDEYSDEKKELLINETYPDAENEYSIHKNMENKFISDSMIVQILVHHVQICILDILGYIFIRSDIDLDIKYLNNMETNYAQISDFLNKNKNQYDDHKYNVLKIEKIFIKYLANFLKIKIYDFDKINYTLDSDLKNDDVISLGIKKNDVINTKIDLINNPLISKYIINKIKIKILDIFINYLENKKLRKDDFNNNVIIKNSILINFTFLLREYQLKKKDKYNFNLFFEEKFFKLFELFGEFLEENYIKKLQKANLDHNSVQDIEDSRKIFYENIYKYIFDIFKNNSFKIIKYYNFYGTSESVNNYLKKFILFDMKKNNVNSDTIEVLYLSQFKDKETAELNREKITSRKQFEQNLSSIYWKNIKVKFIELKEDNKVDILDKLVKNFLHNIDIILLIEEKKIANNFDYIFNENFLKTLNFIINILYYDPGYLKKKLIESLKNDQIKTILTNIIKLNNFIIEHVEYENYKKIFSISKVYFMLMDFIILFQEGLENSNNLLFQDIEIESKTLAENENLDSCEDNIENSTEIEDKLIAFKENLNEIQQNNHDFKDKFINLLNKHKNDFFNKTEQTDLTYVNLENLGKIFDDIFYPLGASYKLFYFLYLESINQNFIEERSRTENEYFDETENELKDILKMVYNQQIKCLQENEEKINNNNYDEQLKIYKELYTLYEKYLICVSNYCNKLIKMGGHLEKENFYNYINKHEENYRSLYNDIHDESDCPHSIYSFIKEVISDKIYDLQVKTSKKQKEEEKIKIQMKKIIISQNSENSDNSEEDRYSTEEKNSFCEMTYDNYTKSSEDCDEQNEEIKNFDYKKNFYYFNFLQMKKIVNMLITNSYENFCCASDKLIVQFLYMVRYLKENVEVSNEDSKIRRIVDKCFIELFDFDWIILKDYNKKDLSFFIRIGVLKLLITYLEENMNNLKNRDYVKFYNKMEREMQVHDLMDGIIECFENFIPENINKETLTIDQLMFLYCKNESTFYEHKEFELAELYYKFLRYQECLFKDLIYEFENDIHKMDDRDDYEEYYKINSIPIVDDNNIINDNNDFGSFKMTHSRKKYILYLKFLLIIGKEVEMKFSDEGNSTVKSKIYFFRSPKCFWMTNTMKEYLDESAPRQSLGAKLDFLNNNLDKVLLSINVSYKERIIRNENKFLSLFYKNFNIKLLNSINFIFVMITNLLLLLYFFTKGTTIKENDLNSQIFEPQKFPNSNEILLIKEEADIIYYQTIFSIVIELILIYIWYIFRFKLFYWIKYYDLEDSNYYLIKQGTVEDYNSNKINNYISVKEKYNKEDSISLKKHDISTKLIIGSQALLFNNQMIAITLCLIFNILYLITCCEILLILQILAVINLFSLFEYFIRAILNKYKQFLSLLIFIYCVEYIFSWISFLHFQEFMINEYTKISEDVNKTSFKELICSTAFECFINSVHMGLRFGGGMGDSGPRISFKFDTKKNYIQKIIYDVFFHIVFNLILANIFFGVIVDAFNEMRDEKDEKENDQKNKCYICNMDRYDSSKGEDFDFHRKIRHNILNYIYLIPYLIKKHPQEYSRAENRVWLSINSHGLDWYPADSEKIKI